MKALYRRGQAFRMMGDVVKARDDLNAAARQAPEMREIRVELDLVKKLEEEEAEKAKQLWKKNFIAEQMSFRAQQGAASVSEALEKHRAAQMEEEESDDEVVIEEAKDAPKLKKGFLGGGKPRAKLAVGGDEDLNALDDDGPRIVDVTDDANDDDDDSSVPGVHRMPETCSAAP